MKVTSLVTTTASSLPFIRLLEPIVCDVDSDNFGYLNLKLDFAASECRSLHWSKFGSK